MDKKQKAIELRKTGKSFPMIERELNVPRSTLSGWLRGVILTKAQREKLEKAKLKALVKARKIASDRHRSCRLERVQAIIGRVEKDVSNIAIDKANGEAMLAMFYKAEGAKKENCLCIANSNPEILEAFINLFRFLYQPDESKFRCCLHLRKDQEEDELKFFWSKCLNIPVSMFHKTQFDKRTNKPTYDNYKGVCVLNYLDISVQRRILYFGDKLIEKIRAVSSAG